MTDKNNIDNDNYDIIMARLRLAAESPKDINDEDQELINFMRKVPSFKDIFESD